MPLKNAVVDGSNIATEGRSEPSLAQLNEAVAEFRNEYDFERVIVIVDASFEHRVSNAERAAARDAIYANEIITPPAGVIGRGDTFILQVADRANAVVVSNDSFQEFHGTYDWLFDSGRLIGGKPIPGIGWIYVPRTPVRGPVSRRATRSVSETEPATATAPKRPSRARTTKKTAKKTMPKKAATKKAVAKKAPAKRATTKKAPLKKATTKKVATKKALAKKAVVKKRTAKSPASKEAALETALQPGANHKNNWDAFKSEHPVGSSINATVESFSSHGAYATANGISVYVPLRLLGDPAPRRARDVVSIGEQRRFVVHRFDPERHGIDVGIMAFGAAKKAKAPKAPAKKTTTKKATKKGNARKAPAAKAATKKTATKKAAKKRR